MKIVKLQKKSVSEAVKFLNNGGAVIFPTDTVYGFIADAKNQKAVAKIFKIKSRPRSKPLAVFVKDIKTANELAEIDKKMGKILKKYWPGKYTFVLNKKNSKGTIAIRIPKYRALNDLLKKINKPLAQTSANISGQSEINEISDIIATFENGKIEPDLVVDAGNLPKSKSSAIMDLTKTKGKFIRR